MTNWCLYFNLVVSEICHSYFFYDFTRLEVTGILNEIPLGLIAGISGKQMSGGKGYSGNQVC